MNGLCYSSMYGIRAASSQNAVKLGIVQVVGHSPAACNAVPSMGRRLAVRRRKACSSLWQL